MKFITKTMAVLFVLAAAMFFIVSANAAPDDGTIDGINKYAWSSKAGWINFGTTNGNVHVTDGSLTGYAWSELYGWINLNPTNGGVHNDGAGGLSGYAWGEHVGWINFSGVTISSNGIFGGQATGDNVGVINFNCTGCTVSTDWRPQTVRLTGTGGSSLPPAASSPPTPPFFMLINNGDAETASTTVTVFLRAALDTEYILLSEDPAFVNNTIRVQLGSSETITVQYTFSDGAGQKTLHAQFCTQWGQCGSVVTDRITYTPVTVVEQPAEPEPVQPEKQPARSVLLPPPLQRARDFIRNVLTPDFKLPIIPLSTIYEKLKVLLPKLFKPAPVEQKIPIEQLIAKETPRALRGGWEYIPKEPVKRFVFAPLPKDFIALRDKFPHISSTLSALGVQYLRDARKLQSLQLYLPGITQSVVSSTPLKVGQFAPMKNIPLGELPLELKQRLPSDVVFVRTAGQLVDFKIALSLNQRGKTEQKVNTISGKPLELAVKLDRPAENVRGYLVFRSRQSQARIEVPVSELLASWLFVEPVFARELEKPVEIEEKLVLTQFEYTDNDGDGIYTAIIQAPVVAGEYEVITLIKYSDPEVGPKQIRLITIVDPEGYVYEKIGGNELRLTGAVVTLFYLNPETKQYEEWPANEYQQENPQVTDSRGTYSFLVPEGMYYLTAHAPGYMEYVSKPFSVEQGDGVHTNIELRVKYWWLKALDWRTGLLIAMLLLLVYNFYRDRKARTRQPHS